MKKVIKYIVFLTAFISFVSVITISLARYISDKKYESSVKTDKFYFTLDLFNDTETSKTYHLYGGDAKTIKFNIQNYLDELRYNEQNITYELNINETNSLVTSSISSGEILGGAVNSDECIINIEEGYSNDYEVEITISSKTPFSKTLTVIFILHTFEDHITANLIDSKNSLYAELTISSNVLIASKNLIIDYSNINQLSNNLQIDLTNYYLLDDGLEIVTNQLPVGEAFLKKATITRDLYAGESLSILFFKADPTLNYSSVQIKVSTTISGINTIYTITISESSGE